MHAEIPEKPGKSKLQKKLFQIIFEADTPAGKAFDVALLVAIIYSVVIIMLESVKEIDQHYHQFFVVSEWVITILFTVEYILRLYSVRNEFKYATGFYGIVDLLSILPTYLSLLLPGSQYFLAIRALRLLRIFRIFKLARYLVESQVLKTALQASRPKIVVFLFSVLTIVLLIGSTMYVIESGSNSGFSSIPKSMYWAIVTLTTVGFGDITPQTIVGQFLASLLMITGYAIIAVPTGIVTVEMGKAQQKVAKESKCLSCGKTGHDLDAKYCKHCGSEL